MRRAGLFLFAFQNADSAAGRSVLLRRYILAIPRGKLP